MSPDLPRALRCAAFLIDRAQTPLERSLERVADDSPDAALGEALRKATQSLSEGASLARALGGLGLPALARRALARGADAGQLAAALRFAAQLAEWTTSAPSDERRALSSLQGALSCSLPLLDSLDPEAFSNPASREQAEAFLAALRAGEQAPFAVAPRLFPPPWSAVLDRTAASGTLPDALDELTAHLDARRVWLTGPGGARATELARVLRFLAWGVRHGVAYPDALELAAKLPEEPLASHLRQAAQRGSLARVLADQPYPYALVDTLRRMGEDDGDLPRTFRALADALDQGLFPL